MGMFDYIICKYPLPRPAEAMELKGFDFENGLDFQTKSLDRGLGWYEMKADGSIWQRKDQLEYIEGNAEKAGYVNLVKSEWIHLESFTGTVLFYDYYQSELFDNDYFVEYESVIINGKIDRISLIKFEPSCNKDRKAREIDFKKTMARKRELENRWYFKYAYRHYRKLIRKTFAAWRKFSHLLFEKLPTSWQVQKWLDPLD